MNKCINSLNGETTSSTVKSLVLVPHTSGIADRILGVASAFFIGLITNRTFQIAQRDRLPYLDLVFRPHKISWRRQRDPSWLIDPLKEEYQTVLMSVNKGRVLKMFDNPHHIHRIQSLNMSKGAAFGCIVDFLFAPHPHIFLPLLREFDEDEVLKIGIQVRVGDWYWSNTQHTVDLDKQFYMFFDCAEQIEAFVKLERNFSRVVWYLLTESMPLRYGSKVITALNTTTEHSSKEKHICKEANCTVSVSGFQTAAAEWWLFALADYHVISRHSGFGRSAAMRAPGRRGAGVGSGSIYTINSPRNNGVGVASCRKDSFTRLEDLATDYSGL
eukprot:gene31872-41357_t